MKKIGCVALALAMCATMAAGEEALTGERVLKMERALYELGYRDEDCDDQMDAATRDALRSFQTANELPVTGEPDEETLALLDQGTAVSCHEYLAGLSREYAGLPILQSGSSGDAVRMLQQALKDLGYFDGACDGAYGDATCAAVRLFQMANGLSQTAQADRSTQLRLYEGAPLSWQAFLDSACAVLGDSGAHVRRLQRMLADMGYFRGTCSGHYGDLTQQAVGQFQARNGLEPTGEADAATMAALYSGGAVALRDGRTMRQGDESDGVSVLQRGLTGLGYFDGEVTGVFGPTTATAVRLFQMANGVSATGDAGEETLALLESGRSMSEARDALAEQARAQDDALRAAVGNLASRMRGQSFEIGDEGPYAGYAFVQYVCVAAGIPVTSPEDLAALTAEPVADPSALSPGDVLALWHEGTSSIFFAIASGEGRAVYATQESPWVLERALGADEGVLQRWSPGVRP